MDQTRFQENVKSVIDHHRRGKTNTVAAEDDHNWKVVDQTQSKFL